WLDVLEQRIALVAGSADGGKDLLAQYQDIGAVHAGQAQLAECLAHNGRIARDVGGQLDRPLLGLRADARDTASRVAVESRPVLGVGDLLRGVYQILGGGLSGVSL